MPSTIAAAEAALNASRLLPSIASRRLRRIVGISAKGVLLLGVGLALGALAGAVAGGVLGAFLGFVFGGSVEVPRSAAAVAVIGLLSGALAGLVIVPMRLLRIDVRRIVVGVAGIVGAVVGGFLGGFAGAGIFGVAGALTGALFLIVHHFAPRIRPTPDTDP